MTIIETTSFLEKVKGIYQRISTSEAAVETWQELLCDISYEKAFKAYYQYLKNNENHDPKPGDILKIARSIYEPIPEFERVECEKCRGTGIITLVYRDKREAVGACTCENGLAHPGLPVIQLPSYNFDEFGRVKYD
ncbi:hypothetical protein GH810_02895 [Acetobacterium paludosum]|uniref:Uncharacterized protein n=1 Tax=Acetobacterium paludosum TaxID=52693 RepID=A0A923KWH0_9FIRM|nr:hypothetical protein [Acetobacterium paludosum]MBC3887256.1 hypothetical protein [Acetobacterium paludosum]